MVRLAIRLMMVIAGVLLVLDVLYFVNGSLETFPRDEQQDTIRSLTGFLAVLLLAAEAGLWALLRRSGRRAV
jgi:hypothetical protein